MSTESVSPPTVLLGLGEDDLGPVRHNLSGEDPHLVVYGDGRSGKTTLLRGLLAQLVEPDRSPADADGRGPHGAVVVVDYRRGLAAEAAQKPAGQSGVAGQRLPGLTIVSNAAQAAAVCRLVATELASRLDESNEAPHGMFNRGDADDRAGSAPEIYLLVDDYDLVAAAAENPLHLLSPYLPHARDVGFHLVLTRRAGGAARAQYEAVLQVLGDLGTPVVMLSGSPSEGRLAHGLLPQPLPTGRARLATRGRDPLLIQIPWVPAAYDE